MKRLLIIDDEVNMQKALSILFKRENYEVLTASNGKEAVALLESGRSVDLVLSDLKMPGMDGLEFLGYMNKTNTGVPVILLTAYGSISEAVGAMKLGATDFITKPFNKDDLKNIVRRTLFGEESQKDDYRESFENDEGVIYAGEKIRKIMEIVRKVAPSDLSILLTGESGTGKGVVAKAIHNYAVSGASAPFVSVNCPAIPDTLLESELFGYQKGAFTGAVRDFPGKVRMADGGTLFLDEIGDLSLSVQAKLLRLLEEGTYEPLGSAVEHHARIRIITATNQDLPEMIARKEFREDLYYRINSIVLSIPPLRDRKEDIEPLARFFLEEFSSGTNKETRSISRESMELLSSYAWPGNVRELRNAVHRAVILSPGAVVDAFSFPDTVEEKGETMSDVEKRFLEKVIRENGGNVSAAARELGISRGSLRHRIEKYGIPSG